MRVAEVSNEKPKWSPEDSLLKLNVAYLETSYCNLVMINKLRPDLKVQP